MFGCYAAKLKGKGSVCGLNLIWHMIANDFSVTGKCNFYVVEEMLITSMGGAAFQVSTSICYNDDCHSFFWVEFQKGSPFLEDFNKLVELQDQMGLEFSQNGIDDYIPNATKCMTWQDVKASHETNTTLVITIKDIYGIMILLALGLGGAMVALLIECSAKAITLRYEEATPIPKKAWTNRTLPPGFQG